MNTGYASAKLEDECRLPSKFADRLGKFQLLATSSYVPGDRAEHVQLGVVQLRSPVVSIVR